MILEACPPSTFVAMSFTPSHPAFVKMAQCPSLRLQAGRASTVSQTSLLWACEDRPTPERCENRSRWS
jgi:hypothetical protein